MSGRSLGFDFTKPIKLEPQEPRIVDEANARYIFEREVEPRLNRESSGSERVRLAKALIEVLNEYITDQLPSE